MIPIYKPRLGEKSKNYLLDAYDATWISSQGKYKGLVEERFSDIFGVNKNNLFLCSNGTTAMHLCCMALSLKYPKIKRILVPDNVYVAAWNTFLMNPVYELVPIKSDKTTWNIDLLDLDKKLCKNDCVLIVHNVGGVINVPKLKKKYPDCVFIEDNCEGIFGRYDNKMTGTESFCSAFSFFGNKTITSGEGGLFYCQDERITKEVKKIHGQGLSKERYVHDVLGFNYRMTNLQAAILLGQLDIADLILERKNEIWNYYNNVFSKFKGQLQLQHQEENCVNANWIYPIMLKNRCAKDLIKFLKNNGVDSRPMFYPMSSHSHLRKFSKPSEEEPARTINKRVIMIPSFPDITEEEIKKVTDCISSFLQQESGGK